MAILIVGGFTVPVKGPDGVQRVDDEIGGDRTRMFTGQMRQTVNAFKRKWTVVTNNLSGANRTSLYSALRSAPPVACSGDALDGAVSCFAQVTGEQDVWVGSALHYVVSFTLFEQ